MAGNEENGGDRGSLRGSGAPQTRAKHVRPQNGDRLVGSEREGETLASRDGNQHGTIAHQGQLTSIPRDLDGQRMENPSLFPSAVPAPEKDGPGRTSAQPQRTGRRTEGSTPVVNGSVRDTGLGQGSVQRSPKPPTAKRSATPNKSAHNESIPHDVSGGGGRTGRDAAAGSASRGRESDIRREGSQEGERQHFTRRGRQSQEEKSQRENDLNMEEKVGRGRTHVIQQDGRGDTADPTGVVPEETRSNHLQNGTDPDQARLPRAVPALYRKRANLAVPPLRRGTGLIRAHGVEIPGLDERAGRTAPPDGQGRPLPFFHRERNVGEQGKVEDLRAI